MVHDRRFFEESIGLANGDLKSQITGASNRIAGNLFYCASVARLARLQRIAAKCACFGTAVVSTSASCLGF